jgi:hypothetical protein
MARDYASFRQALFDFIAATDPGWVERNEADIGTMLVELMAYTGDHLSYYQDAIANEAFLETARQRISVRRHSRLIDYEMHDGASARAFVHIDAGAGGAGTIPAGTQLLARIDKPIGSRQPEHPVVIDINYADPKIAAGAAQAVFEVFTAIHADPDLHELRIYDWGRTGCCLPRGSTRADLMGPGGALLRNGDFLLLEDTALDADPRHRQVVRLVSDAAPVIDPLAGRVLHRVNWHEEDALTFPLCVATAAARGNIVLADHGRRIEEWHPAERGPNVQGIAPRPGRGYRFFLRDGPLGFRPTLRPGFSAKAFTDVDPHGAEPLVDVWVSSAPGTEVKWDYAPTLLSSEDTDTHFTVETDDFGRGMIRFGDGVAGMAPPDGASIRVEYRVGVGTGGNVPAGALVHVIRPAAVVGFPDVLAIRNALPATGGAEPQSIEEVKLTAPATMRLRSDRAVTPEDYAAVAMRHPLVSKAVARFRWTGTWHTVFVTVDPKGRDEVSRQLREELLEWLTQFAQTGYDLEIEAPDYVALEVEIEVCVAPGHFPSDVEQAVTAALGSGAGGFFDPDRFTFGQPLYLSQLYAAVMAVDGVMAADVLVFHRRGDPQRDELLRGAIEIGAREIVRLDNDRNFPEHGVLRLHMRGGT